MTSQAIFLVVLAVAGSGLAFWWAYLMSLLIAGILHPESIDIDVGDS